MKKKRLLAAALILALTALACNIQSAATPVPPSPQPSPNTTDIVHPGTTPEPTQTPQPSPTDTVTPPPTPSGGLSLDVLKNATYHTPTYNRTVKLVNGSYTEGSGANTFSVQLLDTYALGDMNGDGKADAAVILAENGGGSGVFESLVVLVDQAGSPHQVGAAALGDRVQIKTMDISSGVVHLDLLVQGPNDPMCCPSQMEKQNYWLIGNVVWLMRLTTTLNGAEHIINIDYPAIWTNVANPFTVNGNISVLPFENSLAYRILTIDGTEINKGSLTVAPGPDSSGTFSKSFDLSSAGISDWVILQFIDVSAADGSIISLGSVILKTH